MIAGIYGSNSAYIADLTNIQNDITQVTKQISSGVRVSQASDDPAAVPEILTYQASIANATQAQTNLSAAQTEAQTADGALQTASSLLDQLVSIATQGASSSTSASSDASLAEQVQQIGQQLVEIANTSVKGRYIFGGDDGSVAPYSFDATAATPASWFVSDGTPANTGVLTDSNGSQIVPRMTAQQIFASPSGNIFQAVSDLGTALQSANQAGVQTALTELQTGVQQLGQSSIFYGGVENWITQGTQQASSQISSLQQALSSVRDTDIASAATQLSLDNTALQAALAARGSLDNRTLFSFLG
jgi:flagellar hook-associated protein 3 FlgL